MSQSTSFSHPRDNPYHGYRPFGLDPSKPAVLPDQAQRLFEKHLSHLRGPGLAGPPDPIAALHVNGRWRSRFRVLASTWAPLLSGQTALELNLDRPAIAL